MLKVIALLALVSVSVALLGTTQSSGVRGTLMCGNEPAKGVKVKLFDDDRGIDADDLMASGKTDSQGHFEISGHTDEVTSIDPKLNIYHDCQDGIKPCQRKFTIKLPDRYITKGKVPKNIYEAGTIQLAGVYPGESRDCVN
ncbi:unnamed protein product [Auanema sp. JU1783]|nr:unnamed protein product [Auanema sp. JU1783]